MVRKWIGNDQCKRIERMLPGKEGDPGRSGCDNRLFVEAVLWVARTGCPWRDLPAQFGPWNSRCTRGLPGGPSAACGKECSSSWRVTRISKRCLLTRPSYERTSMPLARQKKRRPSTRALARRVDNEDSRVGARPWAAGPLLAHSGASSRQRASQCVATGAAARCAHRGQGLRHQCVGASSCSDGCHGCHTSQGKPARSTRVGSTPVQASQSHRAVFLPHQTLSSRGNALRQTCAPFRVVRALGGGVLLVGLNVNRP